MSAASRLSSVPLALARPTALRRCGCQRSSAMTSFRSTKYWVRSMSPPGSWPGTPTITATPIWRAPYFENWHGFYSEISEVNPPATSKSVTSQTPWLNLPIDWHCVNWVKAYVEGEIYAADGKVVGDASSCMTGSNVCYQDP